MTSGRLRSPDAARLPPMMTTVSLGTTGKNASTIATPKISG